jgi:hypothetical protein
MCAGIHTTQEIHTEDLLETLTETRLTGILHHSEVTHTQEIQDAIGREAAVPVADIMISHSSRSFHTGLKIHLATAVVALH